MVKTSININTQVKAKNIEVEEYEKIMDVWRACMLFFEREIRRLHDRKEISTPTLRKLADRMDFTELLRMTFLSIQDDERMRLVKLKEVAEAIQRVQQLEEHEVYEYSNEPVPEAIGTQETYVDYQQQTGFSNVNQEPIQNEANPISSILEQHDQLNEQTKPEINVKDHLRVLQRNTASSVIELRKMMYQNIQKIKQTLSEE